MHADSEHSNRCIDICKLFHGTDKSHGFKMTITLPHLLCLSHIASVTRLQTEDHTALHSMLQLQLQLQLEK